MSGDAKFVDGFRVYNPRENAPDFIIANVVIDDVDALIAWLQARRGTQPRIDIKKARSGKLYASENDYKPSGGSQPRAAQKPQAAPQNDGFRDDDPDSIPFN